jgi:hypothetical protein
MVDPQACAQRSAAWLMTNISAAFDPRYSTTRRGGVPVQRVVERGFGVLPAQSDTRRTGRIGVLRRGAVVSQVSVDERVAVGASAPRSNTIRIPNVSRPPSNAALRR